MYPRQPKVAISYSRKDSEIANRLYTDLKNQMVTVWIDTHRIRPGELWLKKIDEALWDADYVLGVVTKNYLSSIGGVEAYAKIADGLLKKDISFIPLFFTAGRIKFSDNKRYSRNTFLWKL